MDELSNSIGCFHSYGYTRDLTNKGENSFSPPLDPDFDPGSEIDVPEPPKNSKQLKEYQRPMRKAREPSYYQDAVMKPG
jgi:hypothetical protein